MDSIDPTVVTVVVVAVIVLVVAARLAAASRRRKEAERREHLQQRFGPEYDRAVAESDDTRAAEARLARTEQQREKLEIRPLSPGARARRTAEWQSVQADFVESPVEAVDSADRLVREVMTERGYPADDDDQRLQLLAADHADTVQHYRTAEAHKARFHSGEGSTEDLRRAFVEYRQLFDVLVEEGAESMADPDTRPDTQVRSDSVSGDRSALDDRDGSSRGEHVAVTRPTAELDDRSDGERPVGEHAARHEVDLRDSRDPEPTPADTDGATSTRGRDDRV